MTKTAQAFDTEERKKYIGISELGVVLGIDRWKTPTDLYNEKKGLVEPFQGNHHSRRGIRLEALAAELFTEISGQKLRRMTRDLIHPEFDYIRGHVDRLVEGENRVAEIKVVSVASFRKLQREGLPDSWIVQLNGYIGLGNYSGGVFIIFCPDQFDLVTFDIDFDKDIYNAAIQAAEVFWTQNVLTDTPPPTVDADKPKLEFEKVGGDVTMRDDDAFREAALLLREAEQIKKDGEELYELAKAKVLNAIEDVPGRYEGFGLRLSYTEQAGRKSFDKKALAAEHPEIDLGKYEKQGSPFKTFRAYYIGE